MSTNFDRSLQELLRNHVEQPSLDCWDKISSRLDAMQASNANSTASDVSSFSQFVGSAAGKAAIVAVVASIAAITYFAINDKNETVQAAQSQEVTTTEQDIVSLSENCVEQKTKIVENKTEKEFFEENIVQTSNLSPVDAAKEIEENSVFTPTPHTATNSSNLNLTEKEPSVQMQKTEQSSQTQPTQKERKVVAEPTENYENTAENKDEPEELKPPKIGIPNAFTPNGDNVNDFFVIINIEQVEDTQLDIFTRDGRVVYSKHSYDNTWDGRGLPDGTYFYVFRFMYDGNQFMRRGSVTIKR